MLRLRLVLGGRVGRRASRPPFNFKFRTTLCDVESGRMAFLTHVPVGTPPLLLVTDAGNNCVHIVDVCAKGIPRTYFDHRKDETRHKGYIGRRGSISAPRGVAVRQRTVAVTSWTASSHVVVVHEGDCTGLSWTQTRVIGDGSGLMCFPEGLRFTQDGQFLVVADRGTNVRLISVEAGEFVGVLGPSLLSAHDVEEYAGGWVIDGRMVLAHVTTDGRTSFLKSPGSHASLASAPGLGVFVRTYYDIKLYCTEDDIAMAAMSEARVAWMTAAARARLMHSRAGSAGPDAPP
jgi:hypothetical protein